MATAVQSTSKSVQEQMAATVIALGASAPTSDGLGELWADLATGIQGFNPPSGTDIALAPSTATAATLPRPLAGDSVGITVPAGTTTATLILAALYLPINTVVNNINVLVGTTASSGVAHNWAGLYNSARVPLALSADNTTTDLTASTVAAYAIATTAAGAATSFTTTYSGLHYLAFAICSATTQPTLYGYNAAGTAVNNIAPKLSGTSTTGLTTPPTSFVAAATAITATTGVPYGYLT